MIGEKVGHIKATMAKHLATVMDAQRDVRLEGTIPRAGNAYTLPLVLDFYSTNATDEHARNVAATLQSRLRGDHHFRLAQQYRAASSSAAKAKSAAPTVVKKKLDWKSKDYKISSFNFKRKRRKLLNNRKIRFFFSFFFETS